MKKASKVIGNIVFYLILVILIVISIMAIKARKTGEQPGILGYKFYNVLTGSMTPTINVGDLVVIKDINPNEVKVGDIITFKSENTDNITTHRVKEVLNTSGIEFVTKGDANNVEDPNAVESKYLVGKAVRVIPKVGNVTNFIEKNIIMIISLIIGIAFVSFLLFSGKKEKTK